jgi:hypothetical protein
MLTALVCADSLVFFPSIPKFRHILSTLKSRLTWTWAITPYNSIGIKSPESPAEEIKTGQEDPGQEVGENVSYAQRKTLRYQLSWSGWW